jgi:glucose-6-phosphate isomerase
MINTENKFDSPLYVDTLYQGINSFQWQELFDIVEKKCISAKKHAIFYGQKIKQTENRAVLHNALRKLIGSPVLV